MICWPLRWGIIAPPFSPFPWKNRSPGSMPPCSLRSEGQRALRPAEKMRTLRPGLARPCQSAFSRNSCKPRLAEEADQVAVSPCGGSFCLGKASRDPGAREIVACDKQSRVRLLRAPQCGDDAAVAEAVLRQAPRPLADARDHRIAPNAKKIAEIGARKPNQFPGRQAGQIRSPETPSVDRTCTTLARRRAGLSSFPQVPLSGSACPASDQTPPCEGGCSPSPAPSGASPGRP